MLVVVLAGVGVVEVAEVEEGEAGAGGVGGEERERSSESVGDEVSDIGTSTGDGRSSRPARADSRKS